MWNYKFGWCELILQKACSNPLLYGWLNDNFRKEFQKIGNSIRRQRGQRLLATAARNKGSVASTAIIRDTAVTAMNGQQHLTAVVIHNPAEPSAECNN